MKLDLLLVNPVLEDAATTVRLAEDAGFDGAWTTEVAGNPFLSCATAAQATSRIDIGTAVALAFVRSPMVTALTAWELQRASRGRFILGLGTQVKRHNERRFSVPFATPLAKLREQVLALRQMYAAFQGDAPLKFRGEHYRLDMLPDFFNPGPIQFAPPPTYLAAVNPVALRMSGEVADGVHIHPFHSARYLREVALPEIDAGLCRAGRDRADFTVSAQVLTLVGQGEEGRRMDEYIRTQLAFYGSTRTYRPPLELHGYGALNDRLHELMANGDQAGLLRAVPDELVPEFAVVADTWEEAARKARERYDGLCDRISLYTLPPLADPSARKITAAFAG
ncbi:MAG TPA: TIGR03617 family F420-dependent LLM class oxidoreductase [Sporichthyaceae bacterium]